MRPERYSTKPLLKLLSRKKIVSIDELKKSLGTNVDKTVFRKLKELSYRTSYSHRGKFYTLDSIASFDSLGLWSYKSVCFSIFGTLLKTVNAFIDRSEKGYSSRELGNILNVEVKESLLQLLRKNIIYREKISNVYIYCSANTAIGRKQIQRRKEEKGSLPVSLVAAEPKVLAHELKAAIVLFFSLLDEKQRRLYAGVESMKFGYGGDQKISELLGMDPHTVAKGRNELLNRELFETELQRVRKKGGGRPLVKKKFQK